jgi:hypothetical protein
MGTIATHCRSCGVGIQAPANMAGQSTECPKCGKDFVIGFVTTTERPHIDPAYLAESFTPIAPSSDISHLYFESREHKRYNGGQWNGGDDGCCGRAIEVKTHPEFSNSFLVTVYNLDGVHPVWGTNVQIAGKRMRVIESSNSHITLRGHGLDSRGFPFSNFGITIHFKDGGVDYISLYYHDRDVRLDYLK